MNIYHIISNREWGGREQYTLDLACRQRKDGHYVEIVSKLAPEVIRPFKEQEFPVSTLPLKGFTDMDSAVRLSRMIAKCKNCVIHCHSFRIAFLAIVARTLSNNKSLKIIMTRHLVKRGKKRLVQQRIYKEINRIIFVSDLAKNAFLSGHPKIDLDRITVVHSSITKKPFEYLDLRKEYNIPDKKMILMSHGKLEKGKGIDTLLRAATKLDKSTFHLFILGTGKKKYVKYLTDIVAENHLEYNVTFAGHVKNPQQYISACDIGIVPSEVPEALGLSNMEYMMYGKPLIASNSGAQSEYIIENRDAVLITPGNADTLAETIKSVMKDPRLRETLGENAKKQFDENLNYDNFYKQITEIYDSL